jgi:hypothetical protein
MADEGEISGDGMVGLKIVIQAEQDDRTNDD